MSSRFGDALQAARKAIADEAAREATQVPSSAGISCAAAVVAIGHTREDPLQATLAFAVAEVPKGTTVLLITDDSAVVEARVPELVCEYLPPAADLAETTGDGPEVVARYLSRRLRSILEKWLVVECRWLGAETADLVSAAQSEPGFAPIRFRPLTASADQL